MRKKDIIEIIRKYKNGTATAEERAFLESWYWQYQEPQEFKYDAKDQLEDAGEIWARLQKQVPEPRRFVWWYAAAAAALVLFFGVGYLFRQDMHQGLANNKTVQQDVLPGGNKAVLTLADGIKISLADAKKGTIAKQAGVKLEKTDDGQIIYTVTGDGASLTSTASNTIETPIGGQFQIHLPDGSKVWLNAASSLKYPVCFDGARERKVALSGEAYFEVAKDKAKPFIVSTDNQTVKVLGTHFNINAYTDEASVKTTLLEGSVQVCSGEVTEQIRPDQQAVLTNKHLHIIAIDGQDAIAWKRGNFEFDNADIKTVMRQLSRWYDIQVVYQGEIPRIHYSGMLSRNNNISVILNMLKKTGKINFKIDSRTVTIFK